MIAKTLWRGAFTVLAACGLLAGATVAGAQAVTPPPLSAYGALPSLEMVRLSPSGGKLAFVTVNGEDRTLVVLDLATREQVGGAGVGSAKVRDLDWIDENRVLVTVSKTESIPRWGIVRQEMSTAQIYDLSRNRLLEVLKDTADVVPILASNAEVVGRENPRVLVRAIAFRNPDRLDLFSINLQNGRGSLDEVMGRLVQDFVLDANGQSIARSEYEPVSREWSLYLKQGSGFREVWETVAPIEKPGLVGLGINGDSIIVYADRPDLQREGRAEVKYFDVNLATGNWRPLRFEFEPEGLLFDPVTRRMIGAVDQNDSGYNYAFTDPAFGPAWTQISQAFAGRSPYLVSWSDNKRQIVVGTSNSADPGTYQVVDLDRSAIIPVGKAYPDVSAEQVATIRSISYPAADGLQIHGYLTTPPGVTDPRGLPLVVLAHGGPQSHDTLSFDWWGQALASRGYAVLQANFRGSDGYGDAFIEAGYGEWGKKMQTDLSDGVRYLAAQGIIDPAKVCIVGASYGGYAAMAGPTLDRGVYKCAVAVAGVSDLRRMVQDEANDGTTRRDNTATRYWNRFMGADRLGDRSLDERSPARLAAQADAPMLLIHGRDDSVVPFVQSQLMAEALRRAGKPVELIELSGEDHWLSRSDTRQRMLAETVRFLEANNPPN